MFSVPVRRLMLSVALFITLAASSFSSLACTEDNFSFSEENNRLKISGDVVCTLTDIHAGTPELGVLELVDADNKVWQLNSLLRLQRGARLNLFGEDNGGDVNTLRMRSEEAGFVTIIADWGQVDIRNTFVTSWDTTTQSADENLEDGRSFITVRSFLGEDGIPNVSRLDVIDSEIAYLGYYSGEAYGLTWKVSDDNFEQVDVIGDLRNNYLHHNFRGHYSWGAFGSVLDNNEIAYSVEYGVDPHDDSDELIITNNYIHHSGSHGIICSKRCNDIVITGNVLEHNDNGIMVHSEMTDSLVADNIVTHSRNTGIAVYDSYNNRIVNNELSDNHIGLRALVGSYGNVFESNSVVNSERYGLFVLKGSTESQTTDGRSRDNVFTNNTFVNNAEGIFILESDDNQFSNNTIEGFSEIFVKSGTQNSISGNTFTDAPVFIGRSEEGIEANTIIDDMPGLVLDLDEFSSVTLTGSFTQLKGFEDKNGLANQFGEDTLTLMLDDGKTYLSGPLVDLAFWADAAATLEIRNADLDKTSVKAWHAVSPGAGQSVGFEVGDVLASRQFTVTIDGTETYTVTSTSSGRVTFNHAMPADSPVEFSLNVVPEPSNTNKDSGGGAIYTLLVLLIAAHARRVLWKSRS